jgi:hypothetical protein
MIDTLIEALRTEFGGEVQYHASVPSTFTAPSVVVTPGDPFIEPRDAAGNLVRENWNVLVCVSLKESATGIEQMRELSLRVKKVSRAVGAVWLGASGPRRLASEATGSPTQVLSVNDIHFRYDSTSIVP